MADPIITGKDFAALATFYQQGIGALENIGRLLNRAAGTSGNAPGGAAKAIGQPAESPEPKKPAALPSGDSAGFPEVGSVIEFSQPVTLTGLKGEHVTVHKVKVNWGANAVPMVGGQRNPRPYFAPKEKPAWWAEVAAKYGTATWGQLYAEAKGLYQRGEPRNDRNCGLMRIYMDKFWGISTPQQGDNQGKHFAAPLWQQAAALLWTIERSMIEGEAGSDNAAESGIPF